MTRKTDRRTLYTRSLIKDSFLELLRQKPFSKVNVTAVCKLADITRATFYLHYEDIYAVLDEVLDDALKISENTGKADEMVQMILEAGQKPDIIAFVKENYMLLPVCQRISDTPKYSPLFSDRTLASYILHFIFSREKEKIIPFFQKKFHLDKNLSESLYLFLVSGSFAVNQYHHWKKDEEWYRIQSMLLRFLQQGIQQFTE